jgi:hypothetical protein
MSFLKVRGIFSKAKLKVLNLLKEFSSLFAGVLVQLEEPTHIYLQSDFLSKFKAFRVYLIRFFRSKS